jgi:uncharacterized protein YkwD
MALRRNVRDRHSVAMLKRMLLTVLSVLVLILGGLALTPADAPHNEAAAPAAAGTTSARTLTAARFESRLVTLLNRRRTSVGCAQFRVNSSLVRAARAHSALMGKRRRMSHRLAGEAYFSTRITRAGYTHWRILAENIAYGSPQPGLLHNAWVNSPLHRANMDNCRLRAVGIGVSYSAGRAWATADFGRR